MAPAAASSRTPAAAVASTTQQERDAQARAQLVEKANNAEGTLTIQTTRALHFQHPGNSNVSVVTQPNKAMVVPAWVQHSDTWMLATREDDREGYPASIQIIKDAKPGTVAVAESSMGTDAPKTPAQIAEEQKAIDATHDFYREGAGVPHLAATDASKAAARTDEQRKADAEEQAQRVRDQQLAAQGKPEVDPTKAALDKGAEAQKSGEAAQTAQR